MEAAKEARESTICCWAFLGGGGTVSSSRSLAPAQAGTAPRTAQVLVRACFPSSFWNTRTVVEVVSQNSSEECGEGEAAHLPMFIRTGHVPFPNWGDAARWLPIACRVTAPLGLVPQGAGQQGSCGTATHSYKGSTREAGGTAGSVSPAELHLPLCCFFEMFYESCCHGGESVELIIRTRMILRVKGCYVVRTVSVP